MREINLRAYDTGDSNAYTGFVYSGDYSNLYEFFQELQNARADYQDVNWELTLNTGRKDKNVKDIYDGDICQGDHDFGPGGFHKRMFEVKFCTEKGYQWNYWDMKTIEIMGNKYQNPELLKPNDPNSRERSRGATKC